MLKNPLGARWGLLPTLQWMGSWLPTYLASMFFLPSREKVSQRELNHQLLHLEMSTVAMLLVSFLLLKQQLCNCGTFPYMVLMHFFLLPFVEMGLLYNLNGSTYQS